MTPSYGVSRRHDRPPTDRNRTDPDITLDDPSTPWTALATGAFGVQIATRVPMPAACARS
ncbi:hypothetical protein PCE31107_01824 [Pandoraea cepalis]|uniref:Uncharacterized protein n=1 Tax=Pandoraea cepalis TaxID=2508294 RepID=A0A5E4U404_9BURK|nr:hypothetical protein PCE31107_01824 [Pandoraea cepalis]